VAGDRSRHGSVERSQLPEIRCEISVAVGHSLSKERQRRKKAARGAIGRELAEEWLRINGAIEQVGKLRLR
jgi:hypothetical protein